MRAFHDSRNTVYRAPYGAVRPGTSVTLQIDVFDAPNAAVVLRTWTEGAGECRHAMEPVEAADAPEGAVRYLATLTPQVEDVIWYHFIITDEHGCEKRYGARDGRFGGEGQLRDWEPPSFQLTAASVDGVEASGGTSGCSLPKTLLGFLRNENTAYELVESIEASRENTLPEAYAATFDLLGEADRVQLVELLAGSEAGEGGRDAAKASNSGGADDAQAGNPDDIDAGPLAQLNEGQLGLAKGRLWCASLVQALMPELPASYAAEDAAELWERLDGDCGAIVRNVLDVRQTLPLFANGELSCFAANEDIFGFWRRGEDGTAACLLVNASLKHAYDVLVPCGDGAVSEVIAGNDAPIVEASEADDLPRAAGGGGRCARIHLYQLGSAIAYCHPAQRLELPMQAGLGVLAHVTSLPADGPGTLGAPARAFVDWLAEGGAKYWQILPVNPTDEFGSPYAGISAFAGNTRLLEGSGTSADDAAADDPDGYRGFCEREADWLEPYACFMAIRETRDEDEAWQDWPEEYRRFDPALVAADAELATRAEAWRRAQFAFERQWKELRSYANERGVQIVGDMPIYVSADSADVWANPGIFQLDSEGRPQVVAGCPPDQFAVEGQIWGNPVYDWDVLAESGYDWWIRRLKRAFELYDWVRLDHFIGFSRYFSIPDGAKALDGAYRPGPGLDFFRKAHDVFGPLPIIAEDLGSITPAVRALGAACGFPGMDIVQFVDGNDPLSGYRPRPGKIAFTGTHDNQTLVGYCEQRYPDLDAIQTAGTLAAAVVSCAAPVSVLPLQDVLALGDEARMNVPGTAEGNWSWQADAADVRRALPRLKELVSLKK